MILSSLRRIYKLLPARFRVLSIATMFLSFINSFLELVGLAAILPLFTLILDKNVILTNSYFRWVYEKLNLQSYEQFLYFFIWTIIGFMIVKSIMSIFISKFQVSFVYKVFKFLASKSYLNYFNLDYLEFIKYKKTELLRNISHIPRMFAMLFLIPILSLVTEAIILAFVLVSVLLIHPFIVLIVFTVVAIIYGTFYRLSKRRIQSYDEELNDMMPPSGDTVFNMINGYVDFHMRDSIQKYLSKYTNFLSRESILRVKQTIFTLALPRIVEISMIFSLVIILMYGYYQNLDKEQLVTLLGIFGLAAYRSIPSINRILSAMLHIRGKQYTLDILERISQSKYEENKVKEISFQNRIILENVHFKYPDDDRVILKDISFDIDKGEAVGCIGESGSGKSTIVNLLTGFLEPSSGSILIDDTKMNNTTKRSWRKESGYVKQETFILNGTLAENIALGDEQIDYKKIEYAVELSSLTSFTEDSPKGIEMEIIENGGNLSGGQKQRIGIARALYNGAKFIVFDEATSSLDSKTESEINESINKLKQRGFTIFIVAHRRSTLVHCDRIISLRNGKVDSILTYKELASG